MEEILGEKFLNMYSNIINHFQYYLDVFHSSITSPETIKIEHIKKKIHRKYQKKITMTILREAKMIYEDCALTINIYLQKPVCKRFLLILKTAGFERIKFGRTRLSNLFFIYYPFLLASENQHFETNKGGSPSSKCLLFAPAEYFEDNSTKIQIARILSSSFRINTNNSTTSDASDDPPLFSQQVQQQSPTSAQQPSISISENAPSFSLYSMCTNFC